MDYPKAKRRPEKRLKNLLFKRYFSENQQKPISLSQRKLCAQCLFSSHINGFYFTISKSIVVYLQHTVEKKSNALGNKHCKYLPISLHVLCVNWSYEYLIFMYLVCIHMNLCIFVYGCVIDDNIEIQHHLLKDKCNIARWSVTYNACNSNPAPIWYRMKWIFTVALDCLCVLRSKFVTLGPHFATFCWFRLLARYF